MIVQEDYVDLYSPPESVALDVPAMDVTPSILASVVILSWECPSTSKSFLDLSQRSQRRHLSSVTVTIDNL